MIFHADKIDWQKTDSVLEALILEASLIKKHQPKYNTKEKSDKSFNYVCITKEKIPKVLIARGKDLKDSTPSNFLPLRPSQSTGRDPRAQKIERSFVFGPYTNGSQLKTALQIIRKIFPFIDDDSSKKANIEFYKQIHLTPANTEEYLRNIKNLKLFLHGKKKDILRNLKKEMSMYAKAREFEKAGEIKRQLFALQHINDVALLKNENSSIYDKRIFRIEAYDVAHMSGKNMVGVMTVVENNLAVKSEYKKFKIKSQSGSNDTGALVEILKRRLAHTEWQYPNLIVVDGGVAQINATEKVLKALNLDIKVASVVKDDRHKPKAIKGDGSLVLDHKPAILLGNSEAHRFAIAYHKQMRNKNFLTQ
ncbi:hypothetical protein K8Q98_00145 [Candidatus Nomurabacteria bacterium]|nr:hypothetical protein [Candidatus Nomurabacteria bacterium]